MDWALTWHILKKLKPEFKVETSTPFTIEIKLHFASPSYPEMTTLTELLPLGVFGGGHAFP
jgi:hypothetical protein